MGEPGRVNKRQCTASIFRRSLSNFKDQTQYEISIYQMILREREREREREQEESVMYKWSETSTNAKIESHARMWSVLRIYWTIIHRERKDLETINQRRKYLLIKSFQRKEWERVFTFAHISCLSSGVTISRVSSSWLRRNVTHWHVGGI
jgi:hypothetical protein